MSLAIPYYLLMSEASAGRAIERQGAEPAVVGGRWRFVLESVEGETVLEVDEQEESEPDQERLELLAVVRGLESLDQPSRVTLVTGSPYVHHGLRYGLEEWRESGWQWERFGEMAPVKNADLWRRIDRSLRFHRVECRTWRFDRGVRDESVERAQTGSAGRDAVRPAEAGPPAPHFAIAGRRSSPLPGDADAASSPAAPPRLPPLDRPSTSRTVDGVERREPATVDVVRGADGVFGSAPRDDSPRGRARAARRAARAAEADVRPDPSADRRRSALTSRSIGPGAGAWAAWMSGARRWLTQLLIEPSSNGAANEERETAVGALGGSTVAHERTGGSTAPRDERAPREGLG